MKMEAKLLTFRWQLLFGGLIIYKYYRFQTGVLIQGEKEVVLPKLEYTAMCVL
jgi:hypothetical protein